MGAKVEPSAQPSGSSGRCLPNIVAGRCHFGRCSATPGYRFGPVWEHEAVGSYPAIPTRFFACAVSHCNQARLVGSYRLMTPVAGLETVHDGSHTVAMQGVRFLRICDLSSCAPLREETGHQKDLRAVVAGIRACLFSQHRVMAAGHRCAETVSN